jgi:hypothetical protein
LRVLLTRFIAERQPGERFGDFSARVLWKDIGEGQLASQR